MTVLVIAEHDHATLKLATLNTVTAAVACQSGDVHVLVAGANAAAAAHQAAQIDSAKIPAEGTALLAEVDAIAKE